MNFISKCAYCFGEVNSAGNCMNSMCPGDNTSPWSPTVPGPTWPNMPVAPNTGWICPKCGAGLSPTTTKCDCNQSWTTTDTTTIGYE